MANPHCPRCERPGFAVTDTTLTAMLEESPPPPGPAFFCPRRGCSVVYYFSESGEWLGTGAVRVPVFEKADDPATPVCYCFDHRVGDIEDEVRRTGTSTVPDAVVAACREGRDRCEEANPQGRCCLGNVRAVVARAPDAGDSGQRAHWALAGAGLAAVVSSACCWLPLLAVGGGGALAGLGGFFEAARPYLLVATSVLLGGGFYLAYRKPACAPTEACAVPGAAPRRLARASLWVATALVLAIAAFPAYLGAWRGGAGALPSSAPEVRVLAVEGMTCAGCAAHLRAALESVPGVVAAEVDYEGGAARVSVAPGAELAGGALRAAVEQAGYRVVDP